MCQKAIIKSDIFDTADTTVFMQFIHRSCGSNSENKVNSNKLTPELFRMAAASAYAGFIALQCPHPNMTTFIHVKYEK